MNKKPVQVAYILMLLGTLARCIHLFLFDVAHEPFHLGGLFLAFADEIASHQFHLPVTIPYYSAGGIPFAYPPLGFYVEAIFFKLFPASAFAIVNLLPPLIAVITLGVAAQFFYRWGEGWNVKSLSALTVFTLIPNSFYNQIEAAGMAETVGSLALVIYFSLLFDHQHKNGWRSAFRAGLGLAMCVLASPGSALGASLLSIIFALFALDRFVNLRWRQKAKHYLLLVLIAAIGMIISAPYWLTVIRNHGIGIFTAPVGNQYDLNAETQTFASEFEALWFTYGALQLELGYIFIFIVLLACGWLVWRKKDYFLPLSFFVLFSIPRENAWVTALPLSILVAVGIADVIVPFVHMRLQFSASLKTLLLQVLGGLIVVLLIVQALSLIQVMVASSDLKLIPATIAALKETQNLIPNDSQVIILGNDALREWSPYLLQRDVINTEYGLEWKPADYRTVIAASRDLKRGSTWTSAIAAIQTLTHADRVYIIVQSGYELTDDGQSKSFITKVMDSPALQVLELRLTK